MKAKPWCLTFGILIFGSGFCVFEFWGAVKRENEREQRSANCGLQAKSDLSPVFAWPTLWEWFLHFLIVGKNFRRKICDTWKTHETQNLQFIKFYWDISVLIHFGMSIGAFVLQRHNWVVAAEVIWPAQPKMLTPTLGAWFIPTVRTDPKS